LSFYPSFPESCASGYRLLTGVNQTVSVSRQQSQLPLTCIGKLRDLYKRYHIKHLFPLMFIMLYMVLGSVLFYFLEFSTDQASKDQQYSVYIRERELLRRRMDEIFLDQAAKRREVRFRFIDDAVDYFEKQIGFSITNESQWSLMSAMYYSGTLFTTIGYGDIVCVTVAGRIMTVIYSCVGIPLMLITLNDCGKFLYNNINGVVKRGEVHPSVELSSLASEAGSLPSLSDVNEVDEKQTPRMSVKVALCITIGWIFFCSGLFRLWEDWTYAESCYFMYISLSTIGLGDISVQRRDMMVLCFVFVIIGLSLVSMSINVVQVALEDFYVKLMMKLIIEYQEKMAAGGDHMGASVGMMRMWTGNKTAKYLMPLLSKEKKRVAMVKIEREAHDKGIEVPKILTTLNEKTGIPEIFHLEKKIEGDRPSTELEQILQQQVKFLFGKARETGHLMFSESFCKYCRSEKNAQTMAKISEDSFCQTDVEKRDSQDTETQTEPEEHQNTGVQTTQVEMKDAEVITPISQTMVCVFSLLSQTIQVDLVDHEVTAEVETKNIRIQTPSPVIVQRTIQTEDLEERKSPSKMSSAKKRLKRAFAKSKPNKSHHDETPTMSEWKEVEDEETAETEEEVSGESLHWDPVDGMHAEKQLPVSTLTKMFDHKLMLERKKRY
uniref:Ion_trans_2 domain-containing protein n=1 Tax=Angiostrongylus cantonensis TaxID=6313 RepID=A0A158P7R5_ANGCA